MDDDIAGREEEVRLREDDEFIVALRQGIRFLNRCEATIVVSRFGLFGRRAMTLQQIGERLGITREQVRQIEERALKRLRRTRLRDWS